MLRVGLTGGIASGKSTVARFLASRGADVIDADALAREVLAPGSAATAEVLDAFGPAVSGDDGGIDRPALGRVVFGDPAARARLEAITHPRIRQLTSHRFGAAAPDAIIVHDIPLLVELGMADRYHLVVVVAADEPVRVRRLVTDRAMTDADAWSRVRAQADDSARRAAADEWVDNSGASATLVDRVTMLWHDRLVPFEANLRAGRRAGRPEQPVIVEADASWAAQGERLVARVRRTAGDRALDVAHIGSTAVPGLDAKDILDVQVVVADLPTAHAVAGDLSGAGLVVVTGPRWDRSLAAPDRQVAKAFAANADPDRAVNCHVRPADSPAVAEVLTVRDRLRADPGARVAYARLKHDLASREWSDIDAYAEAKTPFLAGLVASDGSPS